jgi:hypothetical protein
MIRRESKKSGQGYMKPKGKEIRLQLNLRSEILNPLDAMRFALCVKSLICFFIKSAIFFMNNPNQHKFRIPQYAFRIWNANFFMDDT